MADPTAGQLSPYLVELQAGRSYSWCRCGLSQRQPFCDGSHKDSGIAPLVFVAEISGAVNLCGCKQTGDEPYCDGSHNIL